MAPGQVITASVAAAAGVKSAPYARALAANFIESPALQTCTVAGTGIAIAGAGVVLHRRNNGAGIVGPAMVGYGTGLALGAVCDHFGF